MLKICKRLNQYAASPMCRIYRKYAKNMQKIGTTCSLCKPCHQYAKYALGTLLTA